MMTQKQEVGLHNILKPENTVRKQKTSKEELDVGTNEEDKSSQSVW